MLLIMLCAKDVANLCVRRVCKLRNFDYWSSVVKFIYVFATIGVVNKDARIVSQKSITHAELLSPYIDRFSKRFRSHTTENLGNYKFSGKCACKKNYENR